MASAVSTPSTVTTGTGRSKKTSYYVSEVTILGDGSLKRETFRSDSKGKNKVLVQTATTDKNGNVTTTASSNATTAEKQALLNKSSPLSKVVKSTTADANKKAQANQTAANAGQLTAAGKKNQAILGGGSGNNAPNNNSTAQSKPAALGSLTNQGSASAANTRTQFPTLVYPTGLGKSKQDVIRFDIMEYVPQSFLSGGSQIGFTNAARQNASNRSVGSVTLPIPSGISDQNTAEWGSQSMTALDIAKADLALSPMSAAMEGENGINAFAATATDQLKFIKNNARDVAGGVANALAAAAAGVEGQQLLARSTGMVMNPNMELLFKGPALRPFSFKFTLSPRDEDEAKVVVGIIRFFKQGMAPIRSKSNLFLKSPHTFQLRYLHRGDDQNGVHFKLNQFKECALQSFGVNYTPTGNYATYQDGTMVSYEITMGFSELEPVFNDDYTIGTTGTTPDEQIGF
jgi:hypothetical protein